MIHLTSPQEMKSWRKSAQGRIGFVPTMGALHDGHADLLKKARAENDLVVLSIFVNPTQFNDPKDLSNYPKTLKGDLSLAEALGVDTVFLPNFENMYPDHYRYKVMENQASLHFCGKDRPGHFDGVLTVVMKLLNCVDPNRAYFGEKDYQQLQLVKDMATSFFMNCEIVPVPTRRAEDGLALSSRNILLTPEERLRAPEFYRILNTAQTATQAKEQLQGAGFTVDYVDDWGSRRLGAIRLGNVRLIDNVAIKAHTESEKELQ